MEVPTLGLGERPVGIRFELGGEMVAFRGCALTPDVLSHGLHVAKINPQPIGEKGIELGVIEC